MSLHSLKKLYKRIEEAYPGERLVFGDGEPAAPVLLIGEAPGRDEVNEGRPFVGKAGRNLDAFLAEIGLTRADFYVTNVCKFRPTKTSAKNTVSNRPPTKKEVAFAQPFLHEEIELIAPKIIVTLGNTPLRAVAGDVANIGALHGVLRETTIMGAPYHLFPLYHPASIIYNPSLKETYQRDLSLFSACVANIL